MGLVEMLDATAALLAGRPRRVVVLSGLLGTMIVGFCDWYTDVEWAFTFLYLLPITLVTWTAGRREGLFVAGASAAVWFVTDLLTHPNYAMPVSRYWDLGIQAGVFALVTVLLASLHDHLEVERSLARHDPLTGLANRRHFLDLTSREVSRARRIRRPVTVVYIDLDSFKRVNDTRGHECGDRLLAQIGATLVASLRMTDVVARLGGDEFALLLPETGPEEAEFLVTRLRLALLASSEANGWQIGVSIGAASFATPPTDVDVMLRYADRLMYEAKTSGGGGVRFERVDGAPSA